MKTKSRKKIFQKNEGLPALTKNREQAGFTLVELMVSLSLFTTVVLATVSSLLIVNDASRKAQSMRAVMDNLNFAMETMARSIRTGSLYECEGGAPDCAYPGTDGGESISLTPGADTGTDTRVEFSYRTDGSRGWIERRRTDELGGTEGWQAITSPEIDIQYVRFYVDGADPLDNRQPSVTIFVTGAATAANQTAPFSIQTKVSQRTIE